MGNEFVAGPIRHTTNPGNADSCSESQEERACHLGIRALGSHCWVLSWFIKLLVGAVVVRPRRHWRGIVPFCLIAQSDQLQGIFGGLSSSL
jgi:hypothetical protein